MGEPPLRFAIAASRCPLQPHSFALRATLWRVRFHRSRARPSVALWACKNLRRFKKRDVPPQRSERDRSGRSRRLRVRARHEVAREVLKPRIARREPQKNTPKACFFVCEAARPKQTKTNLVLCSLFLLSSSHKARKQAD